MSQGLLTKALCSFLPRLKQLEVDFALVGGLAVTIRANERTTKDIDFCVAVASDREAERILHALLRSNYQLQCLIEHTKTGRIATARVASQNPELSAVVIDLLFASCGAEQEIVSGAEAVEILDGITIKVASLGHLMAMKTLSMNDDVRAVDKQDLIAMLREAQTSDLDIARHTLTLIAGRGFARGKDLQADFERVLTATKKSG